MSCSWLSEYFSFHVVFIILEKVFPSSLETEREERRGGETDRQDRQAETEGQTFRQINLTGIQTDR